MDSRIDLTTNGLILGFFVPKLLLSLISHLYGLKYARIAQFLIVFIFSIMLIDSVLCSLQIPKNGEKVFYLRAQRESCRQMCYKLLRDANYNCV